MVNWGNYMRHECDIKCREYGCLDVNDKQPTPIPSASPAVWDLVLEDMKQRDLIGKEKYKVRLQPNNGRDALIDLYQELLDAVAYCRQEIYERYKK